MTSVSQVINIARSQVGVREAPYKSNRQKYGAWYGWNGVPWCAQFLSWCFASTGGSYLIGGKTASVAVLASRMRARGRYGSLPSVGSIAIFNNYTHTELVTGINSNGTVNTIGGNTGPSSISNGGGVYASTRSRSLIRGYCYPAYAGTPPVVSRGSTRKSLDLVVDGILGANTFKLVQRWVGVTQDGRFGPNTKRALQRKLRVAQDGNFGPNSVRALQRVVGAKQDGSWGSGTTRALQIYLNRIF